MAETEACQKRSCQEDATNTYTGPNKNHVQVCDGYYYDLVAASLTGSDLGL